MPWNDATRTVTDVGFLNPAPLTDTRRVSTRNGHFYDTTGRRVRFLGTNFSAGANFLSKADATAVAARMHKLGFNIVRLHHMDSPWAQPSIFGANRDAYSLPNEVIAPDSMDALDFLVSQFKKNGIYVDLNLHVGWQMSAAGGYPDTATLPEYTNGLSYFERGAIAHQREYARQFLTHVNPYTGQKWADDPAGALIEITNEDSLLGRAWDGSLLQYPPYYLNQLQTRWNSYLRVKYGTTQSLKTAWQGALVGPNLLQNGQFASDLAGWVSEKQAGDYSTTVEPISSTGNVPTGKAVHLAISAIGDADWKQQFQQSGLNLPGSEPCTLRFWAKADRARVVPVYFGQDEAPWNSFAPDVSFNVSTEWKRYEVTTIFQGATPNHSRVVFKLGSATGDLWLADISTQSGSSTDIGSQSLENGSVLLSEIDGSPRARDMIDFLMEVERDFTTGMYDYIKRDLGAKSMVACSQSSFGGLGGIVREARMDWVDHHAYWQYPESLTGVWDINNWRIGNISMVSSTEGGTLPYLASHRVEGKPFTVTEYNHVSPNDFASEALPILAATAASQDWDGFFLYNYHSDQGGWNLPYASGFFEAGADPTKMATMPAVALTFLRGGVPMSKSVSVLTVPRDSISSLLSKDKPNNMWDSDVLKRWQNAGSNLNDLLSTRMNLRLTNGSGAITLNRVLDTTGQKKFLAWNTATPESALLTVDAPTTKSIIGFLGGKSASLDGFSVAMSPTPSNFATILLNSKDNKPTASSLSLLLTALSRVENQGAIWNATRTSVGNNWGTGPMVAEGIPAQISLRTIAKTATVYALDGRGARLSIVPSTLGAGTLRFQIGAQYKTIWYEIVAR